jgi:hypothetical protein
MSNFSDRQIQHFGYASEGFIGFELLNRKTIMEKEADEAR